MSIQKPIIICSDEFYSRLNKKDFFIIKVSNAPTTPFNTYSITRAIITPKDRIKLHNANIIKYNDSRITLTDIETIDRAYQSTGKYDSFDVSLLNKHKMISLFLPSIILNSDVYTSAQRYVYILAVAFIEHQVKQGLLQQGKRWVNVENFKKWCIKNFRVGEKFDSCLDEFLESPFVAHNQVKLKGLFCLEPQKVIFGTSTFIYANYIPKRTERMTYTDFMRLQVEFLYSMPLPIERTTFQDYHAELDGLNDNQKKKRVKYNMSERIGAVTQESIAKMCGISQARVCQITTRFNKVYSFKKLTSEVYEALQFQSKNEAAKQSPIARKYWCENGINSETGEMEYQTSHYVAIGSKLLSHLEFKSSIYAKTDRTKTSRLTGEKHELEKCERRNLSYLCDSYRYATTLKPSTTSTKIALISKKKPSTRPYATRNGLNEVLTGNENMTYQIVAKRLTTAFEKLTSFELKRMILELIQVGTIGKLHGKQKNLSDIRKYIGYQLSKISTRLKTTESGTLLYTQLLSILTTYNRLKKVINPIDLKIKSNMKLDVETVNELELVVTLLNEDDMMLFELEDNDVITLDSDLNAVTDVLDLEELESDSQCPF